MGNRLEEFKGRFQNVLLDFLWRQWSSLGMAGYPQMSDAWIIDPEALLCCTCILGRLDSRLFDETLDWLRENGGLLHLSRLKSISEIPELECKRTLSAMALHLGNKAGTQKWKALVLDSNGPENPAPFFSKAGQVPPSLQPDRHFASQGWLRGQFNFSGKSAKASGNGSSNLLIRMRSLFGVNARAEIITYLLRYGSGHPHEIARKTHYFVKTVQDALVQMRDSGLIRVRSEAGRKIYSLEREAWKPLLFPSNDIPEFFDWPLIFCTLIALWSELDAEGFKEASDLYQSAKLKSWARAAYPLLEGSGLEVTLRQESGFNGEAFLPIFIEDMEKLFGALSGASIPNP